MQVSSYAYSNYQNPYAKVNESSNPKSDEVKTQGLNQAEDSKNQKDDDKKLDKNKKDASGQKELSQEEKQQVSELQARDSEVRAHEAAHLAAAGGLAAGGASFTYQKGPDGKQYAIGGEVPIDTSAGSTPEETIARMRQVKAAATAPANPSGQDMKIASTAAMMEMKAHIELAQQKTQENEQNAKNPYASNETNKEETSPLDLSA